MNELRDQVCAEKEYMINLRRDFHRHPELSLQERRTAGVIEQELERFEISHTRIGATGVLGILRGTQSGSGVVALRADIDALPIQETNDVEYRSQTDGIMHACGHDAHTASLLGAAKVLSQNRDRFGGELRFLFQPAEETGKGAPDFINAGALDGAERILGLHSAPDLPLGTIGLTPGLNNAAVDHFRILVHGKAAHVSTPQLGADALYAASQIVVAIQGLVARRSSPVEPVLLGVGKFAAGTTYNAVAEYAELEGTTRTISQETRLQVREWIDQTAEQIINAGALDGAERILGLHSAPDLPLGTIGLTPGLNNAAVDHFRILVHGKAAHVSTPQLGADALYAASQIVVAIQGLVARRSSPVEPVLLGVGKFAAGTTYNAVAEYAELEGTTRTISQETRLQVREWIDQTAEQIAAISGAEARVIWSDITSALINDPQVSREAAEVAKGLGDHIQVVTNRPLSLGGDNFAEYQRFVPGCYAYIGTANTDLPSTLNSLHNGNFDLDENALVLGAGLYVGYALWWLGRQEKP